MACGGLEPVAVAGDRQHGGVVATRLVGAAGVVLSKSSNSLNGKTVAENCQMLCVPCNRYKGGL